MGIDIQIDRFTPCLLERASGALVTTSYAPATETELRGLKKKGWLFNWTGKDLREAEVYKLLIQGDNQIQGLVAIKKEERNTAYHLLLAESAPQNRGDNKAFEGVGGHLFAIAAEKSRQAGYEGFIYFEAKNMDLVRHYADKFGAALIGMPHEYSMVIDEEAAAELLRAYTLEGGD